MALLTFMTLTLLRGEVVKHANVANLAKIESVYHLCGSSVAYSHHRVAYFGKKKLARKD